MTFQKKRDTQLVTPEKEKMKGKEKDHRSSDRGEKEIRVVISSQRNRQR